MATPSDIGARAEAAVAGALVASGARVYLPAFGAAGRVDLVFEDSAGLHRVQCKTARLLGDSLFFRTCSNTSNAPREYAGEVDFFGVYSPDRDEVYLVPADALPSRGAHLRLAATRNGQAAGVRWARDHLIPPLPRQHSG